VRVPDVRGMDHQAAQNRMQAVGLYNLRELDATGQGRLLIYDRNWTVVDQRPRPGARVSPERKITLISKKDGE
jgi:beta-lactam-binding protein with PASTA domain